MRRSRIVLALAASIIGGGLFVGCSSTVSMDAADGANDPLCAEVLVRLPGTVDGQERRWTDAQSTGAWGDPAAVLLTCGLEAPAPTEARCITIGGIDWIVDESAAPRYRVTTYGRSPAVQVFIDNEVVSSNDVLDRLGAIIRDQIPAESACVASDSVLPAS